MEEPIAHLAPGTLVAERYRVESLLGEGGMGVVYLAEHIHMRKRVALKVLLAAWCDSPEIVVRFEREAVTAGRIHHPHIASATDFGRLPDGSFFLVLEYVAGQTLRRVVELGAVPQARAIHIMRGVLSAVSAAHAQGVVHRDLKPENIMLVAKDDDSDFVKVLDFGIAKVIAGETAPASARGGAGAESGAVLTRMGAVLGTPDYMSPEQALGLTIDARTDLYAVGVIFYELLTGECPFRGGAVTVLRQHVMNEVPPMPALVAETVDPRVQAIVTRLMQKEASARFSSAADVLAALDAIAQDAPASPASPLHDIEVAPTVRPVARVGSAAALMRHVTRRRAIVAGAAALLIGTLVVSVAVSRAASPESAAAAIARSPDLEDPNDPEAQGVDPDPESEATPLPAPGSSVDAPPGHRPAPAASGATRGPKPVSKPARKRRTGPGGIYIPPPRSWFR